ncbi:pentapeptide repeat-containing protein [uncultured Roseovarius sp.]|uniref:pentapeptide repeat-containing protein n=1 Tax=uncultured Roseovarius sp. TaxID=293344 RepID=UPI00260C7C95|nr:pentapeptide repeat-containing protein [uncultured Roseovarius sp.]
MSDLPDEIARINALTTNARNTWLVLLGVLVFVGITMMGVEHIDFYGVDRATKLPLVSVDVPTRLFFVAAPILTAAIYGYFHLYLIRLWDVLGAADARHNGHPLGEVITPWLVSDAALHYRARKRRDFCVTARAMETPAMLLNIVLAWLFGLLILLFMWWQSMPARNLLITGIAALSLLASLGVGTASYIMLTRRMLRKPVDPPDLNRSVPFLALVITAACLILPLTVLRITGIYEKSPFAFLRIATLSMVDEAIVERPKDWQPFEFARKQYRAEWCDRQNINKCSDLGERQSDFAREWQSRHDTVLESMRRPDWHKFGRSKPNFREADLRGAFLSGANFFGANMESVQFRKAQMEGADFRNANLSRANFRKAKLQRANFRAATMDRIDLRHAQLDGANLSYAILKGAKLEYARMEDAVLNFSLITGQDDDKSDFKKVEINAVTNSGGALRNIDLSRAIFGAQTDFRNTFLDGTVKHTERFRNQMQNPCQWIEDDLSDVEFYAYWHWWIEMNPGKNSHNNWATIAPLEWRNVPLPTEEQLAKYNLTDCEWKTGPMPGATD